MTAGRMARYVDPVRIAAEACGILVDPGHGAAYLLHHRHQVALGLDDIVEVEHCEMRASIDEHLSRRGIILGQPRAPGTAVDEHVDWRIRRFGGVKIDSLDRSRSI